MRFTCHLVHESCLPRAAHHSHKLVDMHRGIDGELPPKETLKGDIFHATRGVVADKTGELLRNIHV